jgi:hypothetical protein
MAMSFNLKRKKIRRVRINWTTSKKKREPPATQHKK